MIANPSIQHHHPHSYAHIHEPQQPQRSASRSHTKDDSAASRLPSPPSSSSPAHASPVLPADDAKKVPMDPTMSTTAVAETSSPQPPWQQLSPAASNLPLSSSDNSPPAIRSTVVHVRDLAHVKALAASNTFTSPGADDHPLEQTKYDISAMPVDDIIEMVAALLTKITSTNDQQHDAMQRNVTHQQQANQSSDSPGGSSSPLSHSVLAFHGKNVPGITILSYLARIHKYCPTTFEVFLSLLVYFDRMTERVNDMVAKSEEAGRSAMAQAQSKKPGVSLQHPQVATPVREPQAGDETDSDLADDDDDMEKAASTPALEDVPSLGHGPSTYFVVDSFNIHRLMIAGVTCSSKFFSDVFYTNSRYAKVGGLPLAELNHLELQFLILNDFRLAIPVEELEAYATMLVEFYGREMASQAQVAGDQKP